MNNEEKILSLLETIVTKVDNLEHAVERIEREHGQELKALKDTTATLTDTTATLQQELQEVKHTVVRIENEHGRDLRLLVDGYKANHELYERHELRLVKLEKNVEDLDTGYRFLKHAL